MIGGERSGAILFLAVALASAIFGAAFSMTVARHSADASFLWSAEEVLYRYQTLIAGFAAAAFAWMSVRKVTDQMALQREQHVSDKRFALRKEIAALGELGNFFDNIANELKGNETLADYHLSKLGHFLEEDANNILEHHSAGLPSLVKQDLSKAVALLSRYNKYEVMDAFEQEVRGPRSNLVSPIDEQLTKLRASVFDWRGEINGFLR